MGHPVIMGRKTYDSIGKPLPGRAIIVITRDHAFAPEGVDVVHSLDDAEAKACLLAEQAGLKAVYVAGGGEIYAAFMPRATRLEITSVHLSPEGDACFPPISVTDWREVARKDHPSSPDDEAAFSFLSYQRR